MGKQLHFPGISDRPTSGDVKALVKAKMVGFELRQQERARKRAKRAQSVAARKRPRISQPDLFGPAR
ncbi:MAG: hypothetical protein ACM3ZB_08830 [bacterium]|jgi:hypothetical protein